jgi:hypothetical protein
VRPVSPRGLVRVASARNFQDDHAICRRKAGHSRLPPGGRRRLTPGDPWRIIPTSRSSAVTGRR